MIQGWLRLGICLINALSSKPNTGAYVDNRTYEEKAADTARRVKADWNEKYYESPITKCLFARLFFVVILSFTLSLIINRFVMLASSVFVSVFIFFPLIVIVAIVVPITLHVRLKNLSVKCTTIFDEYKRQGASLKNNDYILDIHRYLVRIRSKIQYTIFLPMPLLVLLVIRVILNNNSFTDIHIQSIKNVYESHPDLTTAATIFFCQYTAIGLSVVLASISTSKIYSAKNKI